MLVMLFLQSDNKIPCWDPFWSRKLAVHISTLLSGRRCHGTLGMGNFDPYLTVESFVAILHFLEVIKKYDASEIALFIIDTGTNEHCELSTAYDLK